MFLANRFVVSCAQQEDKSDITNAHLSLVQKETQVIELHVWL